MVVHQFSNEFSESKATRNDLQGLASFLRHTALEIDTYSAAEAPGALPPSPPTLPSVASAGMRRKHDDTEFDRVIYVFCLAQESPALATIWPPQVRGSSSAGWAMSQQGTEAPA